MVHCRDLQAGYTVVKFRVKVGQRGIVQMVFQSNFILGPTLHHCGSTVDLACMHSPAKRGQKFCDRFHFVARTTGTLDPVNSAQRGLCLYMCIRSIYYTDRSGAYMYIRAYSQYACIPAAGPAILVAIHVHIRAYCI